MPLFGKIKRVKPEQVPYLIARYAREFIPKIRKYLETDYPSRQEGVEGYSALIKDLHPLVKELSERLPEKQYFLEKGLRGSLFFGLFHVGTLIWTKKSNEWKEDARKELQAFLEEREPILDKYGNIKPVVYMYSSMVTFLDFSYRGLFSAEGVYTGVGESLMDPIFDEPQYTESQFRSTYDYLDAEILKKGLIKTLADIRRMIPLIDEFEKKLVKFPPNEELERMLSK